MSRIDVQPEPESGRREWQSTVAGISAIPPQQIAGSLRGQVTDPMGANVTGVTLSLTRRNGAESRAVTDSKGIYSLDGLAPGSYTLRLEVAGFVPYENDQVNVQAGSRQTLDVVLHPKGK